MTDQSKLQVFVPTTGTLPGGVAQPSTAKKWAIPLLATVILVQVGIVTNWVVEDAMRDSLSDELGAILKADVTALNIWIDSQKQAVQALAGEPELRGQLEELAEVASRSDGDEKALRDALREAPSQKTTRRTFGTLCRAYGYDEYLVVGKQNTVLAAASDRFLAIPVPRERLPLVSRVLAGETLISLPFRAAREIPDKDGKLREGVPLMFVAAPVRSHDKAKVIGFLGLKIQPEKDFCRILEAAQMGDSGETFAFDDRGVLISGSRFSDELKRLGLLTDAKYESPVLNAEIRDPGGDLARGHTSDKPRAEQPFTNAVASAIAKNNGENVHGYRNARGVRVVGAWTWLEEHGFGVVTELNASEAFKPLRVLRMAFGGLFLLLLGCTAWGVLSTRKIEKQEQKIIRAEQKAMKLGQYTLEEPIGAGGMGQVYKAKHAMLRRPTAIKMLKHGSASEEMLTRFEREVQATSKLTHPNTVMIYDYGRTPDGTFYYAMEYLPGIDFHSVVEKYGTLPEGRVIHLLSQVCASLHEAHQQNLIHRDIKPANLILCERGGESDVVKVLDFGLVKSIEGKEKGLTQEGFVTGTPEFISPEALQTPEDVDGRSDLYALGAVGYYLLTQKAIFSATNAMALCMKHVNELPEPPSSKIEGVIDKDLEYVIMRCLEKDPYARYQSAAEMRAALLECKAAGTWSAEEAKKWWEGYNQSKSSD